ncbi:MAG: polysaccharide deacetylase family protein [Janthinobacterium lividum]
MKFSLHILLSVATAFGSHSALQAQVNSAYEVATWRQFKQAAITYTLDDNTSKQLPVAIPLFDQYNFKTTLFTVTNWMPNWVGLRAASLDGHEVASHTVTHPSLGTLTVAQQMVELQQSQATIKANVPTAACETVAYPNCVLGDIPTLQQYYLAGRICSGAIVPSTPTDFWNISSIITGNTGSVQLAADFNAKVQQAKTAKGWCVFLTHAIDNDAGYSPTQSTELAAHLAYVNTNIADFWVATFAEVVKYIKERNAVSVTETTVSADELSLVVADNLPDAAYNVPLTLRRQLPAAWPAASVAQGATPLTSTITTVGGVRYLVFDAVPDKGTIRLAKAGVVTSVANAAASPDTHLWPNPFTDTITLEAKGAFAYAIYALDGKLTQAGQGVNSLVLPNTLAQGTYVVKISQNGQLVSSKIVKK